MRTWIATCLAWLSLATSAFAENRLALVVGNDRYDGLPADEQLNNAVNDARAMKKALESLNFQVNIGENLDRNQFIDKLSDFTARLQPGDIAFFFYAGHGASFSGANYLLPRDVPAPRTNGRDEENRLADHAVAETRIVERIRSAEARVAVIVLDACRDNPLVPPGASGRSIGKSRGLVPPPLAHGVLTLYSAGAGEKATDLGEGDSLFTGVLVKELTTPGLGLRELAYKTQSEVAALASAHGLIQEPGVYSQIIGDDVYLLGPPKTAAASDETLAAMIDSATSVDWLTPLIAGLPEGPLKERAKARAEALKNTQVANLPPEPAGEPVVREDEVVWEKAKLARTQESLTKFVHDFPKSKHRHDAEVLLASLSVAPVEQAKPRREPSRARVTTPAGSNCFAFNGERVCD